MSLQGPACVEWKWCYLLVCCVCDRVRTARISDKGSKTSSTVISPSACMEALKIILIIFKWDQSSSVLKMCSVLGGQMARTRAPVIAKGEQPLIVDIQLREWWITEVMQCAVEVDNNVMHFVTWNCIHIANMFIIIIIIIIIITSSFNRMAWQPQTIYIQYFIHIVNNANSCCGVCGETVVAVISNSLNDNTVQNVIFSDWFRRFRILYRKPSVDSLSPLVELETLSKWIHVRSYCLTGMLAYNLQKDSILHLRTGHHIFVLFVF